jgi:lipopolysaccharide transport system permease protein
MKADIHHFIELLLVMTEKELRARYKNTIFGFFWLVANPILQMFVIGFVFQFFMKDPVKYYYYHLFIGLLVWNFFSLSLLRGTSSVVLERSLIKKATFPKAVIPMSIVLSNMIHFIIAFVLFLIPTIFLGTLSFSSVPLLISATGFLLLFTIGVSLLTCSLNVRYRDINFFVQALLIPWFYATPVMYSLSQMPSHLLWIWRLNPLTSILQLYQHAILSAPAPGPAMLLSNVTVILVMTVLGILIFHDGSKTFDDWL